MDFDNKYIEAFNHAMIYEVGGFWNPNDSDTIKGLCATKEQKKKVGYVNDPDDPGGETKYGIAKNANSDVNIQTLDLPLAMQIYYNRYWTAGRCDKMPDALSILHFDGCVNHGITNASKFLQRALGVIDDGVIGNVTLDFLAKADQQQVINNVMKQREIFYKRIVERKPTSQKFLNGWLRRISEVGRFTLAKL